MADKVGRKVQRTRMISKAFPQKARQYDTFAWCHPGPLGVLLGAQIKLIHLRLLNGGAGWDGRREADHAAGAGAVTINGSVLVGHNLVCLVINCLRNIEIRMMSH